MADIKYRFKGHESFILRDGWLTKGLRCVDADPHFFSNGAGADALGVGTNMAKSIRYWLKTAGLTADSSQKGVTLTTIGRTVLEKDTYIEDPFTLWILHSNIVLNIANATAWNLFFNKMDFSSAFSKEEMYNLLLRDAMEYTGILTLSERSLRDDCSAILSMYCGAEEKNGDPEDKKESPFERLKLVKRSGKLFIKTKPSYEILDELVVLYLIAEKLNKDGSMPIDDITDSADMPGKLLNLNRIAVNEYLDRLSAHGFITVNRTAGLDMIYPERSVNMTMNDIARTYYERNRK